jgi:hypothetical protein
LLLKRGQAPGRRRPGRAAHAEVGQCDGLLRPLAGPSRMLRSSKARGTSL